MHHQYPAVDGRSSVCCKTGPVLAVCVFKLLLHSLLKNELFQFVGRHIYVCYGSFVL